MFDTVVVEAVTVVTTLAAVLDVVVLVGVVTTETLDTVFATTVAETPIFLHNLIADVYCQIYVPSSYV